MAALQQSISDKICMQLMERIISKNLDEFAILCQQINEDLRYNQLAQSQRTIMQATTTITTTIQLARTNMSLKITITTYNSININVTQT